MREETTAQLGEVIAAINAVTGQIRKDTETVLLTVDPIEIVKHFDTLRRSAEQIKIARAALDDLIDDLSTNQIPTLFTNRSLKTMNIEGVGRATVSYRWSCSIIDKAAGIQWLKDNGNGGLVQETVNSSTLASFAKEQMLAGDELPATLFKTSTNPYTSITKA